MLKVANTKSGWKSVMEKNNQIAIKINDLYHLRKNYGFAFATQNALASVFKSQKYKLHLKGIKIIDKEFGYIFSHAKEYQLSKEDIGRDYKRLFFFWAQGLNNMPALPREALTRLKTFFPDYEIICLDLNNYKNYVTLSPRIEELFQSKKITIQTFSDILRFNLLYLYGGCWCDATLFFFDRFPISEMISKCGICSLNYDDEIKSSIWGKVYPVTYCTFFFGTQKGSPIMHACVDFFNDYYEKHDWIINYFLNDYMLILCMKYKVQDDALRKIPYIDGSPFALTHELNSGVSNIDLKACSICPQKTNWRREDLYREAFGIYEKK